MPEQTYKRAYVANRFHLELDGKMAGWLHTVEGGQASTEVVQERPSGGHSVLKRPSHLKFDDISITCGTGMSKQFYNWLNYSIGYDYKRMDGAIITANYDFKEITRLDFVRGLISEISFPALDGSSKDACKMSVKIAPEQTNMIYSDGSKSIMPSQTDPPRQKNWLACNFSLDIDGMPCTRVNKIEALTIKQKFVEHSLGQEKAPYKEPTQFDFPNLVITLPESEAAPWYKWHKEFVIEGKNMNEKTGTLSYLTPDLKKDQPLLSLTLKGLGIFKFTPDKLDAGSDKLRMVKIEMYCQNIEFDYGSASTWA